MISRTPVVSSGDVNVNVASHLSNLPAIVVEAFTWKLIELSTAQSRHTGACAALNAGNKAEAKTKRMGNRIPRSVSFYRSIVNFSFQ